MNQPETEALRAAAREAFREYPIPYDADSTARDAIVDFILSSAGVPGAPGERLAMIKGIPHRWNGVEFIPEPFALAENPARARSERDITKPPIIVGIDAEDEEWMNASLGTPRPTEYDTLLRQYRELEAKAGDGALRARLTDPAMVERVAEAMHAVTIPGRNTTADALGYFRELARAALAVIAEPNDVNSTDRG